MLKEHLQHLFLHSEPIGNKEVNLLAKMDLPNLKSLQLGNTNLTTDCLKMLRKVQQKTISHFAINNQSKLHHLVLVKEVVGCIHAERSI